MLIDYLFLPILFFIGLVTSYQDFYHGKIKNKWIIFGATWGIGIWLLLLGWSQLSQILASAYSVGFVYIMPEYILKVAVNSFISLAVGYLLWYFDLWSAGDAKLFFVVSLLLPLRYYWKSAVPYFPSAVLLINIFSFALAFLILKNLIVLIKSFIESPIKIKWEANFVRRGKEYVSANYMKIIKGALILLSAFFVFQLVRLETREYFEFVQINKWYLAFILIAMSKFSRYLTVLFRNLFKKIWLLIPVYLILISYLFSSKFFSSEENISWLFHTMKITFYFGLPVGLVGVLFAVAKKKEKETHMSFAYCIFIGVIITMIINGLVFSLFLNS